MVMGSIVFDFVNSGVVYGGKFAILAMFHGRRTN